MKPSGHIEVDLFSTDVNDLDHPKVVGLRELLEDVALEYHCRLLFFDVHQGTVTFSFDSDTLMAEILNILRNDSKDKP
ncbi:MAG: hypothetical protein GY849_22235 [Deltaproteobacteria bacterium]|nr:hypothetical protein [Deltaproteobacteria bacterium]